VGTLLAAMLLVNSVWAQHPGYEGIWKDDPVFPNHNFYIQHYEQGGSTIVVYTRDAFTFYSFLSNVTGGNTFNSLSMDSTQDRHIQITFSSVNQGTVTLTDNTQAPPQSSTFNIVRIFPAKPGDRPGIWKDATNVFNMYVQDYQVGSTVVIYTFDAAEFKAFLTDVTPAGLFNAVNLGDGAERLTVQFTGANSAIVNAAPSSSPTFSNTSANTFNYNISKVFYPTPLPIVAFSAAPRAGQAPLEVFFVDQSIGTKDSYLWDFGDGASSTDQNPDHTYTGVGNRNVTLTISNISGSASLTQNNFITVVAAGTPPTADFTAFPTVGTAPLNVSFTDTSTGSPTGWNWNFGDSGNPGDVQSTSQHPNHVFAAPGVYTVRLSVTNASGTNAVTCVNCVTVLSGGADLLVADFTAVPPVVGPAPLTVQFLDTSHGSPTSWAWNFGDSALPTDVQSTLQNPTHTYTSIGTYTVRLTVFKGGGSSMKVRVNMCAATAGSSTATMGYDGF